MTSSSQFHRAGAKRLGVAAGALVATLLAVLLPTRAAALITPMLHGQGNWEVNCQYIKSAPNDPIVHPRDPGASHMHDFFANAATTAFSNRSRLIQGASECTRDEDHSAYWAPALGHPDMQAAAHQHTGMTGYQQGDWIKPISANIYYLANHRDPATIQPFPKGLRMVAGDMRATSPQDPTRFGWFCASPLGAAPYVMQSQPPLCRSYQWLFARVVFPDCSDGRANSRDHMSHMAYSHKVKGSLYRVCPPDHPIPVPAVSLSIAYHYNAGDGTELASGGRFSLHADFMEAWQGDSLQRLIQTCIAADVSCGTR
jgi:hypothetical protein